jgi:protein-S-isoprenylcysteine O-methyltransferase Ste14
MLVFFKGNVITFLIGITILAAGEIIRIWGISYAGEETRNTKKLKANRLVTHGPFSYVRNPLYIGNILIYLGFGIFSNALFPYLQVLTVGWLVFQYYLIVLIEEDYLEYRFGDNYKIYKSSVSRFIPGIFPYKQNYRENIIPSLSIALRSEYRTFQAYVSVGIISILIYFIK